MMQVHPKTKRALFNISLPLAKKVAGVGDFNNCRRTAKPMKKNLKGVWRAEIELPEREHQFYYLVDSHEHRNDADCSSVPNNFDSGNSIIQVGYI